MSDTPDNTKKRKRASAACTACHNRKVRCNILTQGIPCSNCQLDGTVCELYRRAIGLPTNRSTSSPLSSLSQASLPTYHSSPVPLPSSTRDISIRGITEEGTFDGQSVQHHLFIHQAFTQPLDKPFDPATDSLHQDDYMPYYAGESEGLEFLFDQTNPHRPDRGPHYLTARKTYRHKRSTEGARKLAARLPHRAFQNVLVKAFFHHVWPIMPIINAKEFLDAYENDTASISPLLLWSLFFSALSFIDDSELKVNKLKPRKVLKEKYYQNAKDIYDRQEEENKSILIQSVLLLASWYVDLDDRDGSWFWSGTAISLCHTIGMHRASTFPGLLQPKLSDLWPRMWWHCFARESWLALAFGRPVRVQLEDCDQSMPTKLDVMEDLQGLADHRRARYFPPDVDVLVESWIVLLNVSTRLNEILTMHYRPRSGLPPPNILFRQEADILRLKQSLPVSNPASICATAHRCHFAMLINTILIALYRPYIAHLPSEMKTNEEIACRQHALQRAKDAAADTSVQVHNLLSMNALGQSPSFFMPATMSCMQIHVYEYRNGRGVNRIFAKHQLDLHMLALQHLRKTYWSADVQYALFRTCLSMLDKELGISKSPPTPTAENKPGSMGPPTSLIGRNESLYSDQHNAETDLTMVSGDADRSIFEPFFQVPSYSDELGSSDWEISDSGSMVSVHSNR